MNAAALAAELGAHGVDARLEVRDGVALLTLREGGDGLCDAVRRDRLVSIARAHGFTHLAVEISADDRD